MDCNDSPAKAPPGLQGQITSWLKHEGWEHLKKMIGGVRVWRYHRPSGWPRNDSPVGLDHPEDEQDADASQAPARQPAVPAVPSTPAAAYLAEQGGWEGDSAPI